jgi:hypothetical protein
MVEDYEETSKTSRFNSAMYEIMSVQSSFNKCKEYKTKGDLHRYLIELQALWDELEKEAYRLEGDDKSKNSICIAINALDKLIEQHKAINRDKLYYWLRRKEVYLRNLWERSGKGGVYDDEDEEF